MTEETLFEAALALPDAERGAFLDRECRGDKLLRARVEALLAAHAAPDSILGNTSSIVADVTAHCPSADGPGLILANKYKLIEPIGEGGMGSVWLAQQSEPIKRKVAVKLIKQGMDSKQVLVRFDAERQALAMMDHPNIAKVLDGGIAPDGRPFFVMELVKGKPITEYCDACKLSLRERLELFVPVCQAIQHAHQKGIIHRDIKPSNVMIAAYDDRAVPKVIDFGVAKATGRQLTDATLNTGFGAIIGTPPYMSPEQATLNNLDIDTRSDVYSLGVLLYELLTGSPPFTLDELKNKGLMEMLRVVREDEPPKPSTRISTANALPTLSANRSTDPGKLAQMLRSDLDWIALKALEKNRTRRYETANGLSADILRYLSGEPVLAHPPSSGYRMRKFLRRHRRPVMAAAFVTLALIGGIAGTTLGLIEARKQQGKADAARTAAESAEKAERQARQLSDKRLAQIEKANEILGSIFEHLNPEEIAKSELPLQAILVEKLDKAVEQLEGESIGDPLVVAAMQKKFGLSLLGLGEPRKGIVLLEKALNTQREKLGFDNRATIMSMSDLATAYHGAGNVDQAVQLLEDSLKLCKATFGPDDSDTLTVMNNLATVYQVAGKMDLALPLFEETLNIQKGKLGPAHRYTLASMGNLASAYSAVGKPETALPLLEEALKLAKENLGTDDPYTFQSMSNLAISYQGAGKLDLALPLLEETLKLQRAKLGPEHPNTLATMTALASAYRTDGKLDQALPLLEEAFKLQKAKLGPDHPDTLTTMNNLALAHKDGGNQDLALSLSEEGLKLTKAKFGLDHHSTLLAMNNLADIYRKANKLDQSIPLFEEALKLKKANLGPEHPSTLNTMSNLASAYQAAGKLDLAIPLFEETLKLQKAKLGPEHPSTLVTMNHLAGGYRDGRKWDQALPLLEETLKLSREKLGAEHPKTILTMNNLVTAYQEAGKLDLALSLVEEALKLPEAKLGHFDPATCANMHRLAMAYRSVGKTELCVPLLEKTLAMQKTKFGPEHAYTLSTMSDLAVAYLETNKLVLALPLFEETLKLTKATLGSDHPRTLVSLGNLAHAYQVAGKFDQALPLLAEELKLTLAKLGPEYLSIIDRVVVAYQDAGKLDQALPLLEEALTFTKAKFGPGHANTLECTCQLAMAYAASGKSELAMTLIADARKAVPKDSPQLAGLLAPIALALLQCKAFKEAEPLLHESMAIREKAEPDKWTTFNVQSSLGGALLGQKKYAEAEPLLLAGYEGLKQREAAIPAQRKIRLAEAADRLVELYTATGKAEELKQWQAERAKYPNTAAKPKK